MNITKNKEAVSKPQNSLNKNISLVQKNSDNAKKAIDNWPAWKKDIAKGVFANSN